MLFRFVLNFVRYFNINIFRRSIGCDAGALMIHIRFTPSPLIFFVFISLHARRGSFRFALLAGFRSIPAPFHAIFLGDLSSHQKHTHSTLETVKFTETREKSCHVRDKKIDC